ncbi:hypothetical protein KM295_07355 [Natronomonas sp. F2-12]|jgi:hypothetical protein|uniref:Uncharacterized protein n=1 Tax=Natronomonas aquatica TaxID=2841590 RepID=A0A9R1D5N5_9EURY|nr:hypothetical protein [Natronomonas aquatica]MCQ4333296.1 hypothetical protein [Natronomonas aquatica]
MAKPARLRDSTEIVLPSGTLEGIGRDLESAFAVTLSREGATVRIIGSPVEIKAVSEYLLRHGVPLR